MQSKALLRALAEAVDIRIDGDRPWDIRVHNEEFYQRVARQGTLGLGESYMNGWWDCDRIDVLVCKAIAGKIEEHIPRNLPTMLHVASQRVFNLQSVPRAGMVADQHYNGDRAMFEAMLDPYMQYSCGYWQATPWVPGDTGAKDLTAAQLAKMEMICRKLKLEPGQAVLDIGCGWGGLARYMAEHYDAKVTGITVATEQLAYAREHAGDLPLEFLLMDYRALAGMYDRVVSVGMFEHVGRKNYATFLDVVQRCLRPEGLFLLHSIGSNGRSSGADPWLTKYIFPNGILPSPSTLAKGAEGRFVLEDWHNFGVDYGKTLLAWHDNFERGCQAGLFPCTERMRRMYAYYLLSCAGAFRARGIQLWQVVLSPAGLPGGYCCR